MSLFAPLSDGQFNIDKIIEKQLLKRLLNSFSTATRLFVEVTDVDGSCVLSSSKGSVYAYVVYR
jgi:ligand-binding sensor protein